MVIFFSDINLSILELLTSDLANIDYIDYAFSLGQVWDDGDGKIGYDYTVVPKDIIRLIIVIYILILFLMMLKAH